MNKLHIEQLWDELNQQPVYWFADWPNKEVPKGKPGVYLIYQGKVYLRLEHGVAGI